MSSEPLKILLVEDDLSHRLAISRAFKVPGQWVDIREAGTLAEYRNFVEQESPDIVVMDLNLPDGQALSLLRETEGESPYPVIIMTSYGDEKIAVAAMKSGALDYIVKSASAFAQLPYTVGRALREWDLLQRHKQAQADIVRASHLASLGELAAGVAHEINNPINGVINYAQLLVNRLEQDATNRGLAERIIREGDRIATIVRSLLAFAGPQRETGTLLDIAGALHDCLALASAQLQKEGIILRLDLAENLPHLSGFKQQLQQVFLNLISNARYALNERYPPGDPQKILEISACQAVGSRVRLVFKDYGTGIPAAVVDKVLNPFFTTKPADRGTGLGLSISYGIVTNHGGTLKISSDYGHFTVATVELPLIQCAGER